MAEGVFPRAGRYLGSRPVVWLAGLGVNGVILLSRRWDDRELTLLAGLAAGIAAVLVVWALDTLAAREPPPAPAEGRHALRRLAAVAFAIGVTWALTSIVVWLVPAVEGLVAGLDETATDIY